MDNTKELAKEIATYIKGDKKTKGYDTAATVKRIENGIAYVQIPSGVDETPVKLTIDAKAGDQVQVHVANGTAWLVGNASAPPTDDTTAISAKKTAISAEATANRVHALAEQAEEDAATASAAAASAVTAAGNALTAANSAQSSADSASEYASRALGNLSTVQSVAETLTWITAHGTMTLTTDVTPDPTHVYFVVDAGGDYTVNGVVYSIVTEPVVADMGTYYELSIDESLNNYVGTHLALDSEGLWLLPASSGTNKVLIATGAGSQYTVAGTYLIDASNNVAASFRADGATMSASGVQVAHLGYGAGKDSGGGTSNAPYYDLGVRSGSIGNYSVVEGYDTEASAYCAHAEGNQTTANDAYCHAEGYKTTADLGYSHAEGNQSEAVGSASHAEGGNTSATSLGSHAEGSNTTASDYASHAEGYEATASGYASHAQNRGTCADQANQTAIGKWNTKNNTNNLFAIGNGTADNARSDAFTVDTSGNVVSAGNITDGSSNVLANKADSSSLATVATSGDYNDLLNKPTIPAGVQAVSKSGSTGSISSNGYKNLAITPTAPAGKSLIGCIGVHIEGTNSSYCQLIGFYTGSGTIQVQMKNTYTGAVTWTVTATGLYA